MSAPIDFLDELRWRGLIHQATHEDELRKHLADPANHPRRAYAGFDPTSDSLTIGNLVPIMLLVHFRRAGHEPIVVMGGGTGLIGDPSGKSAERMLLTEEQVRANVESQREIFERIFRNAANVDSSVLGSGGAGVPPASDAPDNTPAVAAPTILNNLDWLGELKYLEVLRDIGKHFSVNMMIQKDSVRDRLHARDQGISYTEFSYMILQAYDFLHLYESQRVTLQMGGSDQWGNIVAGTDLIRKHVATAPARAAHLAVSAAVGSAMGDGQSAANYAAQIALAATSGLGLSEPFGLTAPLITKSDGTKFGKTESGAIWLSAHRTSPYAYYQFWLNAADADVERYLKTFTLLPREEIEAITQRHAANPGAREAQRVLAREATRLLHGPDALRDAEAATQALFSGDIASLPEQTFREVLADVPATTHDKAALTGDGVALVDLLPLTSLAASKREAREFLASGAISTNGKKAPADTRLKAVDLLHGSFIALRRGKKNWHLCEWK